MKLAPAQTNEKTLALFGAEASLLVKNRDFSRLAERFGYALAYGRDIALAIERDFEQCLNESEGVSSQVSPSVQVKYFKPNSAHLFALVECISPVTPDVSVLVELIVSGDGEEKHITLEQISVA